MEQMMNGKVLNLNYLLKLSFESLMVTYLRAKKKTIIVLARNQWMFLHGNPAQILQNY